MGNSDVWPGILIPGSPYSLPSEEGTTLNVSRTLSESEVRIFVLTLLYVPSCLLDSSAPNLETLPTQAAVPYKPYKASLQKTSSTPATKPTASTPAVTPEHSRRATFCFRGKKEQFKNVSRFLPESHGQAL